MSDHTRDNWYRLELGEDGMALGVRNRNYSPDKIHAVLELSRAQAYQLDLLLAQFAWAGQQKIEEYEMRMEAEIAQSNTEVDFALIEEYDVS